MVWRKLKKVIIPLIIAKIVILVFFIFSGDVISISRDINSANNYQEKNDSDSLILKRQKLIRIVRNEENRSISIKLRGKKNSKTPRDKEGELSYPIVD